MAYLDLKAKIDDLNLAITFPSDVPVALDFLSSVERETIRLARFDRASSIRRVGRLRKVAARLFGLPVRSALADPRLEALRRFAIAVAHDTQSSVDREKSELRSFGYTCGQIGRAEGLAARYRRQPSNTIGHLLALPVGIAGGMWFVDFYLGNLLVSFITTTTVALPIWTMFAPSGSSGSAIA
jgi:hypothetical protein